MQLWMVDRYFCLAKYKDGKCRGVGITGQLVGDIFRPFPFPRPHIDQAPASVGPLAGEKFTTPLLPRLIIDQSIEHSIEPRRRPQHHPLVVKILWRVVPQPPS